jgi:hypothetical protein
MRVLDGAMDTSDAFIAELSLIGPTDAASNGEVGAAQIISVSKRDSRAE